MILIGIALFALGVLGRLWLWHKERQERTA